MDAGLGTDAADFSTGLVADAYATLRAETFDPSCYAAFVRAQGEPALEVGCGAGEPLLQLVADGLHVDGVDSSPDMVVLRALRAFRRHLTPRGTVVIPLWIAGPTPPEQLGTTREALGEDGVVLRCTPVSEEHDTATRTRRTAVRYERVPRRGQSEIVERDWVIHWQTRRSIAELAAQAGLVLRDADPAAGSVVDGRDDAPGAEFTVLASPAP